VLVRALHLTALPGVARAAVTQVTYLHLMFDRHEIIIADGTWSESFQPNDCSLGGMDGDRRQGGQEERAQERDPIHGLPSV